MSLLRMLGALLLVLGALVCTLWVVRRHDLTLPRKWLERLGNVGPERRLKVVERLALDPRRSVVLLRRDDTEFSVMIGPEGVTVLDRAPVAAIPTETPVPTAENPQKTEEKPLSFAERIPILPDIWFTPEPRGPELH